MKKKRQQDITGEDIAMIKNDAYEENSYASQEDTSSNDSQYHNSNYDD